LSPGDEQKDLLPNEVISCLLSIFISAAAAVVDVLLALNLTVVALHVQIFAP
jgi:hypothetical protein